MYSRTSRGPRGTCRVVCGSTRLPRVPDDVPARGKLVVCGTEVVQDRLAEVTVVELLPGEVLDVAACGVHDLARLHRQSAATRGLQVGLRDDLVGCLDSRDPPRRREDAAPGGPRVGLADLAPV